MRTGTRSQKEIEEEIKIQEEYERRERFAMWKAERIGKLILLDKKQLIERLIVYETLYDKGV